ncbi:MAG: glycosyl hydrolase family 28-related protein [Chthoniobacteraceae bacterium]
MKSLRSIFLLALIALTLPSLNAALINAKDFGAIGDGKTDSTAALQAALDAASGPDKAGQLYIPAGDYLISKTLVIEGSRGLIVSGDGSRGFGTGVPRDGVNKKDSSTALIWIGPDGGTLLETRWSGAGSYRDLSFCGSPSPIDKPHGRAGILFRSVSKKGGGNMLNKLSNISFCNAKTGIYMGGDDFLNNDSDVHYDSLTFFFLDQAFVSTHRQAVNYQFDWVFALGCGTVFHFQEGGNALINNAQLTRCRLVVWIEGGDKNSGTYLINNMRQEGGGKGPRWQLLRATTKDQAVVHFTNFDDVQWYWFKEFEDRPIEKKKPLCEIGPGVTVVFDTSIFNGPLASVTGSEKQPALLTVRDSNFNYIEPDNAVTANEWGFFKLIDNRMGGGQLFPNTIKWPKLEAREIPANQEHHSQVTLAPPSTVVPPGL